MRAHTLLTFSLSFLSFVRNSVAQGAMPPPQSTGTMIPSPSSTATIVLVPGAFHVDSTMDLLGAQLQQAGYDVFSASLVTVNGPNKDIADDVSYLQREVLDPLIKQQGRDVVLYLHSYAGFPGSTAIDGYSKAARLNNGSAGGLLGLIYQSAFIPQQNSTLKQMIGGVYAPWQQLNVRTRDLFVAKRRVLIFLIGCLWTHHRSRPNPNILRRRPSTPGSSSYTPTLRSIDRLVQFTLRPNILGKFKLRQPPCLHPYRTRYGLATIRTGYVPE